MTPVRLEPATLLSRVKHSTTALPMASKESTLVQNCLSADDRSRCLNRCRCLKESTFNKKCTSAENKTVFVLYLPTVYSPTQKTILHSPENFFFIVCSRNVILVSVYLSKNLGSSMDLQVHQSGSARSFVDAMIAIIKHSK